MFLVGLTGGIASGKSSVSDVLKELGCPIIDADVIAREVVEPGKPSWKLIVSHFGRDVLLPDTDKLDRPKLARIIFEDERKRRLLNQCTHSYIQKAMLWQIVKHFIKGESIVVLVSPLLYESGASYIKKLSKVIVVNCTPEQQLSRLVARDMLTEEEALKRIKAQIPLIEKCRKADIVLDNCLDKELLRQQTYNLHTDLQRMTFCQRLWRRCFVVLFVVTLLYCLIFLAF